MASRFAGKRVLLIGDSHLAGFPGDELQRRLEAAGATVQREARVGRSATDLTRGTDLEKFEAALGNGPNVIVFMLGTNDMPGSPTTAKAFADVWQEAVSAVNGAPDVWAIGPPSFSPNAKAADGSSMADRAAANAATMAQIFGPGFIDSRPLTADLTEKPDRAGDLIHFNKEAGTTWGDAAFERLDSLGSSKGWLVAMLLFLAASAVGGFLWWRRR
jgi:lysophospholipase L1-like esterase